MMWLFMGVDVIFQPFDRLVVHQPSIMSLSNIEERNLINRIDVHGHKISINTSMFPTESDFNCGSGWPAGVP